MVLVYNHSQFRRRQLWPSYCCSNDAGAGKVPNQMQQAPSRVVVRNEGLAMAVGSRSHLENEALAQRSWYRNFLMRGFHLLVLTVAGGAIRDTQCGFKVSRPLRIADRLLGAWRFLLRAAQQCLVYSVISHLRLLWKMHRRCGAWRLPCAPRISCTVRPNVVADAGKPRPAGYLPRNRFMTFISMMRT